MSPNWPNAFNCWRRNSGGVNVMDDGFELADPSSAIRFQAEKAVVISPAFPTEGAACSNRLPSIGTLPYV